MKKALIFFVSIVCGFFLMAPLGIFFDKMDLPLFHTWGLAHGSFLLAWPMLTVLSFVTIKFLLTRSRKSTSLSIRQ